MRLILLAVATLSVFTGCQTRQPAPAASPAPAPTSAVVADLQPLSFMVGRWITVNPEQGVAEEHWMTPRGGTMMGMFRMVRAETSPQFYEILGISSEPGGVFLRQRRVENDLDMPSTLGVVQTFRLTSTAPGQATFTSAAGATLTYSSFGPNQLTLSFTPDACPARGSSPIVFTRDPQ